MTTAIKDWSTTPGNNNSAYPNGAPEGMPPSAVNDVIRQNMSEVREWYEDASWIDLGLSGLTYVDGDTFRVTGDQTTQLHVGRRVRAIGTTPFTIYGYITASVYDSTNTTIDVTFDSGSLDNTLSELAIGPEVTNKPIAAAGIQFKNGDLDGSLIENSSTSKTADYTLLIGDKGKTLLVDATSGDVTITADAALEDGYELTIVRTDDSANTVTFEPDGSQTVNGETNTTLTTEYARLKVVSNGSNWFLVAGTNIELATSAETITGTDTTKATTPAGVKGAIDNYGIGMDQSWQDLTASRALDTEYTNSTDAPIQVAITIKVSAQDDDVDIYVNSVKIAEIASDSQTSANNRERIPFSFIVPPGHTYEATTPAGSSELIYWAELTESP